MAKTNDRKIAAQTPRRLSFIRCKCVDTDIEYCRVDKIEHEDILVEITIERYMAGAMELALEEVPGAGLYKVIVHEGGGCVSGWERDAMPGF